MIVNNSLRDRKQNNFCSLKTKQIKFFRGNFMDPLISIVKRNCLSNTIVGLKLSFDKDKNQKIDHFEDRIKYKNSNIFVLFYFF